jgi:hypothetical protein
LLQALSYKLHFVSATLGTVDFLNYFILIFKQKKKVFPASAENLYISLTTVAFAVFSAS